MAAVGVGLAVTAQLQSLITPGLRIIGEAEGMPLLPLASIMLLRNPDTRSPMLDALAEHIVEGFRL